MRQYKLGIIGIHEESQGGRRLVRLFSRYPLTIQPRWLDGLPKVRTLEYTKVTHPFFRIRLYQVTIKWVDPPGTRAEVQIPACTFSMVDWVRVMIENSDQLGRGKPGQDSPQPAKI